MKWYERYSLIVFLLAAIYYLFKGVFFTSLLLFMGCFWVFMAKCHRTLCLTLAIEVNRYLTHNDNQQTKKD